MTSSSTHGAISHVTQKDTPPGRSLLSRLKSPLQSKTRHFADFYIQLDDPHRQYGPGDVISGRVIIKVVKYFRIVHLVISLHGYAQVFKNPHAAGDAYKNYSSNLGSGKGGKKEGSYYGNGFVSLFDDEVALCGEGRLDPGVYHFNFELEFPTSGLPSSIDFERGTISYMLTSTLTRHFDPFRPVSFSPTTSCDTKVYFQESIDIASIPKPKPRVISLEPISRLKRVKTGPRKRPSTITEGAPGTPGTENAETLRAPGSSELAASTTEESDGPGSPTPSDVSYESRISSGNSGTEYGIRSIHTTVEDRSRSVDGSSASVEGKTITASIDILKGAFLRGDQIPIKISVKHTKHVRSFRGIIVTLYRQARVDMNPALPIINSKGDKIKSEDYYPKSRTGLGGLSLSSAGSSHLFRKDLAQSFAPLFVDPRTLTAESKCSIRIPEEAFPTISNVPGAMITFRYFLEVVVDIQGRLVRLDRMLPEAGSVIAPTEGGAGNMFSNWGTFLDTDAIRREKGVISSLFEIVIGTKDSERNGKQKQVMQDPALEAQFGASEAPQSSHGGSYAPTHDEQPTPYDDHHGQFYDQQAHEAGYTGFHDDSPAYYEATPRPFHQVPTNYEAEEGLSEKERLRRAEARLLPSQPPGPDEEAGPAMPPSSRDFAPSAPHIPEDDDQGAYLSTTQTPRPPPSPPFQPPAFAPSLTPSAPPIHRRVTDYTTHTRTNGSTSTIDANTTQRPSTASPSSSPAPQYIPSPSPHILPTEDKQELQRRRLLMERSAPPGLDEDDVPGGDVSPGPSAPPVEDMRNMSLAPHAPQTPSAPALDENNTGLAPSTPSPHLPRSPYAPSAPVLDEDDEGLVGAVTAVSSGSSAQHGRARHTARNPSEDLPVYER